MKGAKRVKWVKGVKLVQVLTGPWSYDGRGSTVFGVSDGRREVVAAVAVAGGGGIGTGGELSVGGDVCGAHAAGKAGEVGKVPEAGEGGKASDGPAG